MACYEDIKSGIIGKVQSTHIDGRFTYKTTRDANGEIDEGVYIIYNESPKITRAGDKSYAASKLVANSVQKAIERDYPGVKVFITPQDFNQVVRFKVVPQAELINKYLAQENLDGFSYQITNNPKDTSPRVLSDNIMSYYNLKEEVIEAKKKQLEKYKIRESAKKNTSVYRDFVLNLDEEVKTLENELAQLNVNDITNVLDFFDKDLDDLINFLDTATDEQIKNNYSILKQVIDDFSVLITGRDGNNNDYYNYKIDFSQFTSPGKFEYKLNQIKEKLHIKSDIALEHIIDGNVNFTLLKQKQKLDNKGIIQLMSETKEDIGYLARWYFGGNEIEDTLAIQAIKPELNKEEVKVNTVINKLKDEFSELAKRLKDKGFDIKKFSAKDENGIRTGNIVSPFEKSWYVNFLNRGADYIKNNSDLSFVEKGEKIHRSKNGEKRKLYKERIDKLDSDMEVIDFRKITSMKSKFESIYPSEFTFSQDEMDQYEQDLKSLLGESYDMYIEDAETQLIYFQNAIQSLARSQNKNINETSQRINPFTFLKNYNSADKYNPLGKMNNGYDFYSDIKYLVFIPKDQSQHNQDFQEISKDRDAIDFWKKLKEINSDIINPLYKVQGKDMELMSMAMFKKDFLEEAKELLFDIGKLGIKAPFKGEFYWHLKEFARLLLKEQKALGADVGQTNVYDTEVISNYSNTTKQDINRLEKLLLTQTYPQLVKRAERNNLNPSGKSLEQLANMIAKTEILDMYSEDIVTTTKALLDKAALQMVRENVYDKIEILKEAHLKASDPQGEKRVDSNAKFDSLVNTAVMNKNNKGRGINSKTSRFWTTEVGKNYYNNHSKVGWKGRINTEIQRLASLFTEEEKKAFDLLTDLVQKSQTEDVMFSFEVDGETYYNNTGTNSYKMVVMGNEMAITKEEYLKNLEKYVGETVSKMGTGLSFTSAFIYMRNMAVYQYMIAAPISGIMNRLENINTIARMDASGRYWIPGNADIARNKLKWANTLDSKVIKLITGNKSVDSDTIRKIQELRTFRALLEKLDVLQDRQNELQRNKDKDSVGNLGSYLYSWAINNPEFKGQGTIVLASLMDVTVNTVADPINFDNSFLDEDNNFRIYEPGTLKLKPEFRTPENILNWEQFGAGNAQNLKENEFLLKKQEITEAINTQSNFDKFDSTEFSKHYLKSHLFTYMRWMPPQFHMRWHKADGKDFNLITGERFKQGLYRELLDNSPMSALTFAGLTTVKNIGYGGLGGVAIATGGVGAVLLGAGAVGYSAFALYQSRKDLSLVNLRDFWAENADPKQTIDGVINMVNFMKKVILGAISIPITSVYASKNVNTINFLNAGDSVARKNLTQDDIKAINAAAMELSQSLFAISMYIMAAMAMAGDDEEEKKQNLTRNFVLNKLWTIATQNEQWTNPVAFTTERSKFVFLQFITRFGKLFGDDDEATKGFKAKPFFEQVIRSCTTVPKLAVDAATGIMPYENEYDLSKTAWFYKDAQNINTDGDYSKEKEIKKIRTDYKNSLKENDEELSDKELNKLVNKKFKDKGDFNSYDDYYNYVIEKNSEIE